jgi:biopolymer transport protein ExbB
LGLLLAASVSTWAVLLQQAWRLRRVQHDLSLSKALFWQAPDWQQGLQVLQDTEKEGWLSRLGQAAQAPTAGSLAASAPLPAQTERALRDALHQASARLHHGHTFLASVAACAPFVGLLGTVWGVRRALLGLVDGGDASRVVAAVFQLTQALQQLGSRLPRADQGNDPAHGALITKKARLGRA